MRSSLFDPSGHSALAAAAGWVQNLLLGPFATVIAVIAVAWFGFMMLQGSISIRRGGRLILGCFILFGSAAIAQGLTGLARTSGDTSARYTVPVPVAPPAPQTELAPYDPYAGASVPRR